jgi:RDD family
VSEARTLEDFPLREGPIHEEGLERSSDVPVGSRHPADPSSAPPAPFAARVPAAAADAAMVLLLTALAVLAARLVTGSSPDPRGLPWVAAFALYLSAFATVVPLVVFGRTVGMALADLTVRSSAGVPGVAPAAAIRRWFGTLATAATGGLLLLWTARDGQAPTPADRLSGCALIGD